MKNIQNKCYIIGGGPSVKDVDFSKLKHEYVYGINEAFRLGKWIDTWFFGDSDIFKNHREDIEKWPNRIVSCAGAAKRHKKIEYYNRCKRHNICYEHGNLAWPSGRANSGATCINLAIKDGFKSIILIGFDMKVVDGKHHYHDYYKKQPRDDAYERFMLHFEDIAKETDVEILNANPDSALPYFPKITL